MQFEEEEPVQYERKQTIQVTGVCKGGQNAGRLFRNTKQWNETTQKYDDVKNSFRWIKNVRLEDCPTKNFIDKDGAAVQYRLDDQGYKINGSKVVLSQ